MERLYAIHIQSIVTIIKEEGWAFIFTCIYLFFEYVRPQSIYTAIDVFPFVPLNLALAFGVLAMSGQVRAQPNPLNKLMICYASVVLFSSMFSEHPSFSLSKLRVFFDWFIVYFLIVLVINNERRFFIFFLSFLLYSFKMSQHGFISWAAGGFSFDNWGVTGAPGWFHNSGEVGIQMCIYVPLSVAFILSIYKYLSKPKLLFFLLMPLTGIGTAIASSSRGALVGLLIASARTFLIKPKFAFLSIMIFSLAGTFIFLAIPEEFKVRFEDSGTDRTSAHRLERWAQGFDAMNKHPLLGVGFEVWPWYHPAHYQTENPGTSLVHNIFIQCGSELGYTGLAVFISMILICFANTRKVRQLSRGKGDCFLAVVSYGFDAGLLGFLGSGFFVTVLYYPYFWIHCAMTVSLHTAARKKFASE